jgi:tetratricopeptide (TPR) repeat protein
VSIVGRADLLCSFFLLSGCLLATRSSSRALFPLLAFLSLLALLSKEQGIVLPLFWAAVEILKTGFRRRQLLSPSFLLRLSCPLITLLLLAWYRLWTVSYTLPSFQPGDNPAAALPTLGLRALNLHYYASVSALLLISPHWLCFDWALGCLAPLASPLDPRALAPLLLWLLLLATAGRAAKDAAAGRPLLLWASALTLLPFLLSANLLVTVGFVVAERSLYLSVAGVAVAVTHGWQRLVALRPALRFALPAVLLILALRSATRSADWRSELTLFSSGLAVCPGNAKVFYNIAKVRADSGEVEAAALCYREAVRLTPTYEHALNNLGNLERARGEPVHAAILLRRAIRVSPKFAAAHMNLAIVEQAAGQVQEAEVLYLAALGLRSPYADCEYNLANLYLKSGRTAEAEERLRAAAALGHTLAWGNLVLLLEEEDRMKEAHEVALRAVQLFPDNPELRFHLANSHGKRVSWQRAGWPGLSTA